MYVHALHKATYEETCTMEAIEADNCADIEILGQIRGHAIYEKPISMWSIGFQHLRVFMSTCRPVVPVERRHDEHSFHTNLVPVHILVHKLVLLLLLVTDPRHPHVAGSSRVLLSANQSVCSTGQPGKVPLDGCRNSRLGLNQDLIQGLAMRYYNESWSSVTTQCSWCHYPDKMINATQHTRST